MEHSSTLPYIRDTPRRTTIHILYDMGMGQKINHQGTAGFSPWFHFPKKMPMMVPIFDPQTCAVCIHRCSTAEGNGEHVLSPLSQCVRPASLTSFAPFKSCKLPPPVLLAFYPFLGGFPYENRLQKKGYPYSSLSAGGPSYPASALRTISELKGQDRRIDQLTFGFLHVCCMSMDSLDSQCMSRLVATYQLTWVCAHFCPFPR